MIKIKYNGIKIKTDSIDEAVAILEALKVQPTYTPAYTAPQDTYIWLQDPYILRQDPYILRYEPHDWSIPYSGTGTTDTLIINGKSHTVTSN